MSKKQKNVSKVSNYIEHLHILVLLDVYQELKSISQQLSKKKHGSIVFLAKNKLSSIEILISKSLIDSYISMMNLLLIMNMLLIMNVFE